MEDLYEKLSALKCDGAEAAAKAVCVSNVRRARARVIM
jgi:hypothetical protein